jgi:hypothetical protein
MMPSPEELFEQDRQEAIRRGDLLNQQAQDRLGANVNRGNQYESYLRNLYMPEAEGGGGYSPEEMELIRGEADLGELQMTPEEAQGAYLTGEEQAGVAGDPYARMNYYRPDYLNQMQMGAEGAQRGAAQGLGSELRGVAGSRASALGEDYLPQLSETLNRGDTAVQQGIEGTEGAVRGAIDRRLLAQNPELAGNYRMSDAEKQDIITGAGISAGTGYRAAIDSTERAARAAGTDPLGVAAYRARTEREMAGEAGDAMTQARIQADREQAQREMALEQNRQQAEQYLAGATVGAEQDLGSRRLAAQNTALGRRLGAMSEAEQMRMGGERDIANRRMQAASEAGQANIGTERAIQGQQQQVGQFNVRTGMEGAGASEAAAAERARNLAGNRQQTQQYLSGQRYGRGMDINQLRSGRAQQIANTRLGAQQQARGFFGGLQEQANTNVGQEANRQGNLYGTQGQLREGASRGYLQASQAPRWWERAIGAGAQAVGAASGAGAFNRPRRQQPINMARGGVVTEPTLAVVGESGPEAVVPLNSKPDNYGRPSMVFGSEVVRTPRKRFERQYGYA